MSWINRITRPKPSGSMIATGLAFVALFVALGGGAWALTTKSKSVDRATTFIITPDATPGTPHQLFTIGQVSVNGYCTAVSGSTEVSVGFTAGPDGAVIAKDVDQASGGQVLGANESSDP